MSQKEFNPKLSREDRLMRRLLRQIDMGDEIVVKRIYDTLSIDSETNPDIGQVRAFVEKISSKPKHGRKRS